MSFSLSSISIFTADTVPPLIIKASPGWHLSKKSLVPSANLKYSITLSTHIGDCPKIIASFKTNFSRTMPKNLNQTSNQLNRREKGIWQRKYYDHIIRDEKDFNKHLDYIHYNSMKHLEITPKDWEFSSFNIFVKNGFYEENWCNFDDRNNINEMDLE